MRVEQESVFKGPVEVDIVERSSRWRPWAAIFVSGVVAFGAGCGGDAGRVPVYPVEGKVLVGGEVPEGALVVLYSQEGGPESESRPSAKVKPDGSFSLMTYEADDGEYTATIEWNKLVKKGTDFVAGPNAVPREYANRETSPWKLTVTDSAVTLPPLEIAKP